MAVSRRFRVRVPTLRVPCRSSRKALTSGALISSSVSCEGSFPILVLANSRRRRKVSRYELTVCGLACRCFNSRSVKNRLSRTAKLAGLLMASAPNFFPSCLLQPPAVPDRQRDTSTYRRSRHAQGKSKAPAAVAPRHRRCDTTAEGWLGRTGGEGRAGVVFVDPG